MAQPLFGAPSESSIKRRRRLSEALLSQATDASPKGHWTQALAQGLNGYLAGRENRLADKEEGQRSQALADALSGNSDPNALEQAGVQYGAPELMDVAQNRRSAASQAADDAWRQQRAATQDSQWQQSFGADEAYRQQMLAQRSQQDIPSGYRQAQGGALEAIPGGPADPNKPMPARALRPTTDQANAAGFYDRMNASEQNINKFAQAGMDRMNVYGAKVPLVGNELVSSDYQQYDQARRDFINAQLRKESGAVITPEEFDNANKQYFPQPGDGPEVLAQKQRNRQIAIEAMKRTAGPALGGGMATGAQQDQSSMDFGEVGQIPEGAVVEDEQGARFRKENGTLVPVQ